MAAPLQTYDVQIDTIGLMLARQQAPQQGARQIEVQTILDRQYPPYIRQNYRSLHGGSLHSQRQHPTTNSQSTGIDASERYGRTAACEASVTETSLTVSATAQTAAGAKFVEITSGTNAGVYLFGGRYIRKIASDYTVSAPTANDLGSGAIAQDATLFNGNIVIACGSSKVFQSFDGSATLNATHANGAVDSDDDYADYFLTTNTKDRLIRAHSTNCLRYLTVDTIGATSDPMDRTRWSARYRVEDTVAITGLARKGYDVLVAKIDGIFEFDQNYLAPNIVPEFSQQRDVNNGKNLTYWAGRYWIPYQGGLYWYEPQSGASGRANLDIGAFNDTGIKGQILCMAPAGNWIYIFQYDSGATTTYLHKCRLRNAPGFEDDPPGGPLVPNQIASFSDRKITAALVSSVPTQPTLFMAATKVSDGSFYVAYAKIPKFGAQAANDSGVTFPTGKVFYSGSDDLGMDGQPFEGDLMEVEADNLSGTQYLDIDYKFDTGGWQRLGSAKTSPITTLLFPRNRGAIGRRFEWRETWTVAGATTPVVRRVTFEAIPRPKGKDLIPLVVTVGKGSPLKKGTDTRDPAKIIRQLRNLARTGGPVTFHDTDGNLRDVVVQEGIHDKEITQEGSLTPVREVTLTLRQVGPVLSPGQYGTATYGGGNTYS